MKKILVFLFLVCSTVSFAGAGENTTKDWTDAADYYKSGDYRNSILIYERMLQGGEHSADLYYNLGSSYFKNDRLGLAILNFERALMLDPSMEDAEYNLDVARARTTDRIESVPTFFLVSWVEGFGSVFSSDSWAVFALLFLAVALAGVLAYMLIKSEGIRKLGLSGAVIFALFAVVSFLYSAAAYDNTLHNSRAVVVNTASVVRSSPQTSGKEIFVLHEGTTLDLLSHQGEWCEIRIADGNKGWLTASDIAEIEIR